MQPVNDETQKVIDRIRKMLAMANDKANIHESAVAASMAEKLMRKYELDMSDITTPEQMYGARDVNEEWEWYHGKEEWKQWLAVACSRLNDCEIRVKGTGLNKGFVFVGVGPDPTVACEIYKYLHNEVNRLAKAINGRAAINSFRKGAAHEVAQRLKQLKQERAREYALHATGTALVIHKAALITQSHGYFGYRKSNSQASDYGAFERGREAGRGINLDDQVGYDKRGLLE